LVLSDRWKEKCGLDGRIRKDQEYARSNQQYIKQKQSIVKKLFFILALLIVGNVKSKAQIAVSAPVLEALEQASVKNQVMQTKSSYETQLNSLNTAKNTLDNLDKIKEIDKRITEVNQKLKQVGAVSEIFSLGSQLYKEIQSSKSLINKLSASDPDGARSAIANLQSSANRVEEMVLMCKKILSNDFAMNDYERLTLLNEYKTKITAEISTAKKTRKKFSFVSGINAF